MASMWISVTILEGIKVKIRNIKQFSVSDTLFSDVLNVMCVENMIDKDECVVTAAISNTDPVISTSNSLTSQDVSLDAPIALTDMLKAKFLTFRLVPLVTPPPVNTSAFDKIMKVGTSYTLVMCFCCVKNNSL